MTLNQQADWLPGADLIIRVYVPPPVERVR